jgi:uncharacterized membrane protein
MIRSALTRATQVDHHGFRIRSREVSRLEGLSDAVFGFAITLLVVSLEVPQTFDELMAMMRGFVAFAASFAVLTMIWYEHYTFFRRYGFEDLWIIILNCALLFVVVLYIYPLKFMFSAVIGQMIDAGSGQIPLTRNDGPALMTIYSVSIIAVFGLLACMYAHAYRNRARLELDEVEILLTRSNLRYYGIWIGIAVFSILLSRIGGPAWVPIAGMSYGLLGPLQAINGYMAGKRVSRMRESEAVAAATGVAAD